MPMGKDEQNRSHTTPSEGKRHRYPQAAAHHSPTSLDQASPGADFRYRSPTVMKKGLAIVRQALLPGGAMEQTCAKPGLQPSDRFADRRPCQMKAHRRRRKSPGLRGFDKNCDVIQGLEHAASVEREEPKLG